MSLGETRLIREGDLILIAGLRHSADLIMTALAESRPFSHIGIAVTRPGGLHVLHSVHGALTGIDGVQQNTLSEFAAFARPASILVVRPLWTNGDQAAAACALALQKLAERVPFDDRYDWKSDDSLYCGEFIAKVLDKTKYWNTLSEGKFKAGVLCFSSFLQERRFMPIINHGRSDQP